MRTVMLCQQGSPFEYSPARNQMVDELRERGSEVFLFIPDRVKDERIKKIVDTRGAAYSSVREQIKRLKPDIVICFTEEDTRICFSLPYIMRNTYFYYYNLEIYVEPKTKNESLFKEFLRKTDYWENKIKEIVYVKGCRAIVVQDSLRKRILKKHGISHPATWLIPNSYYADERRHDVPHKNGLIYSGGVGVKMLGSFTEHIKDIKDVEITISGVTRVGGKFKDNPNIKVITQNLSVEEYTRFISAYDIALIWYSDYDDNMYNIGLSSGKFFKHMSIGQPVIANNVPGLAEEIRKYKLGVVINDVSELGGAVRMITDNYDFYVKNVKRVYKEKYDYKKVSKTFYDSIIHHAARRERRRNKYGNI